MSTENFTFFGIGAAVGITVAILFAPKSGTDTRGYLRSKAQEGKRYVSTQVSDLQESAVGAVNRGKQAVRHQKENIADAVDAGLKTYREAVKTTPAV